MVPTGPNTYSGTTTISAGIFQVGDANAIPTRSDVTDNGTLDLDGFSDVIGALSGTGIVTSNVAGAATLNIGASDNSGSFTGVIQNGSGTVTVTKAGTGTETLAGANTYTGVTTIAQASSSVASIGNGGTRRQPWPGDQCCDQPGIEWRHTPVHRQHRLHRS